MKTWDEVVEDYRERWITVFSQGVEGFSEQACREIVYAMTPKTGKWMPDNNNIYETRFICSECKESEVVPTTGFTKYKPIWNYCPNCGARMLNGGRVDERSTQDERRACNTNT